MIIPNGHVPPPYDDDASERLFAVWKDFAASQNYPSGMDQYPTEVQEAVVREFFPSPAKLLFLGCGNGAEVLMAQGLGHEAYGVTLNPNNAIYAREKLGLTKVLYRDAHILPQEWAAGFAGVLGFQFLEHSVAPVLLLVEVLRVLQPNGIAYFETPGSGEGGWVLDANLHHLTPPTKEQAHGWLLKAGLSSPVVQEIGPPDAARHLRFWGRRP